MVGRLKIRAKRPLHPCGEIALICLSPSPDRRLAADMRLPISPRHRICCITVVQTRTHRVSELVSATPATPFWVERIRKAILDDGQKGWSVAFGNEDGIGICNTAVGADLDILLQPLFCHETRI